MKNKLSILGILILTSFLGVIFLSACKKKKTTTTTTTKTLTLLSNDMPLQAYSDEQLTKPITDLTKIATWTTVYIRVPKANVDNKTASVTGADSFVDSTAVVAMNDNKTISATYGFDTSNFVFVLEGGGNLAVTSYNNTNNYKRIGFPAVYRGTPVTIVGDNTKAVVPANIQSIILPSNIVHISDFAFANSSELMDFSMPNTVATIGQNAFSGCKSLRQIIAPNMTTSIGSAAFNDCTSLSMVILPNVKTLPRQIFSGCTSLDSLFVGDITNIESDAFDNCPKLTRLMLPASTQSLAPSSFTNCMNLTTLWIKATTPPSLNFNMLSNQTLFDGGGPAEITIYVPQSSLSQYSNSHWTPIYLNVNTVNLHGF